METFINAAVQQAPILTVFGGCMVFVITYFLRHMRFAQEQGMSHMKFNETTYMEHLNKRDKIIEDLVKRSNDKIDEHSNALKDLTLAVTRLTQTTEKMNQTNLRDQVRNVFYEVVHHEDFTRYFNRDKSA